MRLFQVFKLLRASVRVWVSGNFKIFAYLQKCFEGGDSRRVVTSASANVVVDTSNPGDRRPNKTPNRRQSSQITFERITQRNAENDG